MLRERLNLVEHEISKIQELCADLYERIAIKGNNSTAQRVLYQTATERLAELTTERKQILDLLNEQDNSR